MPDDFAIQTHYDGACVHVWNKNVNGLDFYYCSDHHVVEVYVNGKLFSKDYQTYTQADLLAIGYGLMDEPWNPPA